MPRAGGRPPKGPHIRPRERPKQDAAAEQAPGLASSVTATSAPSVVSPLFDQIPVSPGPLDMTARQAAKLFFIPGSHRKMTVLARLVRGLPLQKAMEQLEFSHKAVARRFLAVLRSARANAAERGMSVPDLYLTTIRVTRGPQTTIPDYKARSRTGRIIRRSGHLFVELSHMRPAIRAEETQQHVARIAKRYSKRLKAYRR